MFSIPSVYELGTCSDSYDHNIMLHQTISSSPPTDTENPNLISPRSMAEAKAAAASNTHKEAERQRRKRINAHIATLKSILPTNIKTDKASLLGEAVRRVKELKKKTAELRNNNERNRNSETTTMFPNETDEVKICRCENSGLMKVTLSCEDRPDIIMDMIQALKAAEAKAVRAEMSTVGGRTNNILWVNMVQGGSDESVGTLRRAMRMVMDKSALLAGSGQGLPGNKRPRYYHL